MLSNTATPRYYGEFRAKVLMGEIPVCKEIEMEMNRIDALIANPNYYYDEDKVEGFIQFCEGELTLVDGSPVEMLDTFKLWAEEVFGWYYFVERSVYEPYEHGPGGHYVTKRIKKRLVTKQYIILGRGGAKSMYASFIQSYFHIMDPHTKQQIAVSPTVRQSDEVLFPYRTAIARAPGPVFKFLTDGSLQNTTGSRAKRVKLASTKKGIENFITNSVIEVRPLSIDKLQGLRCKIATLDEWLSGDIRQDPIGAIEQGAAKNGDDYLIVAISSEGTVRNGIGDTIKMELRKILRGEYVNDHVSIWYYKLDDVKEVGNPAMWVKAQPNIGKTVTYETYQEDVERMEHNPSTRNDILAKRFGIEMEGYTYFFSYEETKVHNEVNFWGMPCSLGIDLSQGDDFCAFTFLFPLGNGLFGVKTRNYITHNKYLNLPLALRDKYDQFIEEGTLFVFDGVVLDLMDVYDDVDRYITDSRYDINCVGYDPYNAKTFIERWERENGPFGIVKVPQGARTESVPLGEIKHMSENRMLIFDQSLMSWAIGNCIVITDSNGNRKLYKLRNSEKIDPVAALMDAYVAYKENTESFK